ncbi:MAG: cysteine peptidase family C39 domain-containing protein [Planctomycetota bacterium]|nr:cysteine peptidase family C39 domain-containing protein [Planctomycetota bacterium]
MADLYVGLVILGGLTVAMFLGSLRCSYRISRVLSDLLAMLVVVVMFYYIRHLWYNVRLTAILPFSNLIVIGNWLPPLAGLLAGFAWRRIYGRIFRKTLCTSALAVAACYAAVYPLLGEPPKCGNQWDRDGICLQTTQQTCTAASAATLLRLHGIKAAEAEMAELCLTREGTTWLGLYRGLKRKTQGTRWDVEVIECSADEISNSLTEPMILSVGLGTEVTQTDESRLSEWGWRPGQGHSVLLLGKGSLGGFKIADPTPDYGIEMWSKKDLEELFQGTAVRLIERS